MFATGLEKSKREFRAFRDPEKKSIEVLLRERKRRFARKRDYKIIYTFQTAGGEFIIAEIDLIDNYGEISKRR